MSEDELEDEGFDALIVEMAALEAITEASRGEGPVSRASELARQAWEVRRKPTSFEEHVTRAALARVLHKPLEPVFPSVSRAHASSWTVYVYETITLAWLKWSSTGDVKAMGPIRQLRNEEPDTDQEPGGAVELLALHTWGQAVEKLAAGDDAGARRLFERAIEVGSQIGSDSNPTVNWCYAASFFHH